MSRLIQAIALTLLILGLTPPRSSAEMVVTLGNDLTLAPGGTGTINISISYTPGTSTDNTLADFGLGLIITPVGMPTSILQFTTTSPDPYSNPNYVFYGQSFGADNGIPFWYPPSTTTTPYDTINGGDTDDSSKGYVTIPPTLGGTTLLLGTVQFQAAPGATPGDSFQISLINNPGLTYFDGQSSGLPYIVTPGGGLVTVSAIPEPTSLVMAAISSLGGLLIYWRTRRRSPGSPSVAS